MFSCLLLRLLYSFIMILGKETYLRGIVKIMGEIKDKKYKVGIFNI
jgi:hypothetical protein